MPAVTAVLSVAGIATGIATGLALSQALVFQNALYLALGACLAILPCYALTRRWLIAAMTALAPLPGLIWAAPVSSGSDFGLLPFLAYGLGFAAALFYSDDRLTLLLQAGPEGRPLRAGWMSAALATVSGTLLLSGKPDMAIQIAADSILVMLSVTLLLPMALSFLHFDEDFIAEANRAREERGRVFEGLAFAATPRWGLSLSGICLVLMTLSWYGAHISGSSVMALGAAAVLIALGWWTGGGWREGLALGLAFVAAALLALWILAIAPRAAEGGAVALQAAILTSFLALCGLAKVRIFRQRGELPAGARGRMLEETGPVFAAVCGVLLMLTLPVLLIPGAVAFYFVIAAAGLSGGLLAPAVVTALEALFPRKRRLEELYVRKS
ncbi:hypothetical protein GCM10008941_16300 [Rhizomicrobium palustre]